ncbi:MAG: hypothetical protein EOO27_25880 [Comamonadaceae bacterium]|nr:MAG: hypothetical protein EOO27_25880 [Comamonadaceae bacterium]
MGIYSHCTDEQLTTLREQLIAQLHGPASGSGHGRSITQRSTAEIRRSLNDIAAELASRNGTALRGPIYLV